MRRSLQTIVLHEAKRCIEPRVSRLRPFQKRALLMSMVFHIMREIDFLKPSEKEAVLWKTQRRQEQIDPVTAWKRCKIIERDLGKLLQQLQPYSRPNRTHQQSINVLVQDLFVSQPHASVDALQTFTFERLCSFFSTTLAVFFLWSTYLDALRRMPSTEFLRRNPMERSSLCPSHLPSGNICTTTPF